MDVKTKTFRLKNELQVLWRIHRWHLLLMFSCVIAGGIIGWTVITNPSMSYSKISTALIDANLTNATFPNATIGNFIFGRLFDVGLALLFLFIACLHSWTALLCFPYLVFRGFALVLNLYWIVSRFGMATGLLLLINCTIFLIIVTVVFACATLFIMRSCTEIRHSGARCFDWKNFLRMLMVFAAVLVIIALMEWLVYAVLLSKIVFIPL